MKCFRCGFCCQNMIISVVENPDKGLSDDNMIMIGYGKHPTCPHLKPEGDRWSCLLHHYEWFKDTPCGKLQDISKNECETGRPVEEEVWKISTGGKDGN